VQTFTGQGLLPLAPVHVRATRSLDGDIDLVWIRRTRTAGDSWALAEVPLGEAEERYGIDILDGNSVKRSLTSMTTAIRYAAADQIADFGSIQGAVTVRIAQLSATMGRGHSRTLTV
jgi:hypothetical protein